VLSLRPGQVVLRVGRAVVPREFVIAQMVEIRIPQLLTHSVGLACADVEFVVAPWPLVAARSLAEHGRL
jgi:hypothetical protein